MTSGSGGNIPASPDPNIAAEAQARWNQPNVVGPNGSQIYSMGDNGREQINLTGSPAFQAHLAGANALDTQLGAQMPAAFANLPTSAPSTAGLPKWTSDVNQAGMAMVPNGGQQETFNTAGLPGMATDFGQLYKQASDVLGPSYFSGRVDKSGIPALQSSIDTSGIMPLSASTDPSAIGTVQHGAESGGQYRDLNLSGVTAAPSTTDFGAQLDQTQGASYQRALGLLQPQMDLDQRRLATDLEARGLPVGSEAYTAEHDRLDRSQGAQRQQAADAAIAAGNAQQGQLFGEGMAGRQQGVSEAQSGADTHNQNVAARFGQNLSNANLNNSATSQAFQQALSQFQTEYGVQKDQAQFGNQAQAQAYSQALSDMQAQNAAQQQVQDEALKSGEFTNAAQSQAYAQALQRYQAQNEAQSVNYNQDLGVNNLQFSQAMQKAQLGNATRQASLGEQLAMQDQQYKNANSLYGLYSQNAPAAPPFLAPGGVNVPDYTSQNAQNAIANRSNANAQNGQIAGAVSTAAMIAALAAFS